MSRDDASSACSSRNSLSVNDVILLMLVRVVMIKKALNLTWWVKYRYTGFFEFLGLGARLLASGLATTRLWPPLHRFPSRLVQALPSFPGLAPAPGAAAVAREPPSGRILCRWSAGSSVSCWRNRFRPVTVERA